MMPKQSLRDTARPDPGNNLGRGAPGDREDRIRQRANIEQDRAAQDLDREDAEIQAGGAAGPAAGTKRPRTKERNDPNPVDK